jgi:regulator of sirC expression with transglutaminase-like and TPR domain
MSDARAALEAIGRLPDVEIDIGDAALQLARVDAPEADWAAARTHLTRLARAAVAAAEGVPAGDLAGQAAALGGVIAGQFGYRGDTDTYDDPANANLIRVIERRRGLPVALGVLWLHAARAAGWRAHGLDFPGHFLLGIADRDGQAVVDVFRGGATLDARDLRGLIKRVEGPEAELRPGVLAPMGTRAVLMRLQNNILVRRLGAGALNDALGCLQDMLRISPDAALLWRDAAELHERLDHVTAALKCWTRFVALVPEGGAAERGRAAIAALRSRLN